MSGHHARPGPRPRRTHPAVWAIAAVIIVLAVGACSSSTTTTTSPTTSAVPAASAGPGGHRPTLIGTGSTFEARLHLTGPVLAGIYLGQITRWNEPALSALNPGVASRPRRSTSCTAPTAAAPPTSSATTCPPSPLDVNRTPFSIGYIEQAYSTGLTLPFAAPRNQAGTYVIPSAQTVAADTAQRLAITATDFSIVNQPGASSYPISGYVPPPPQIQQLALTMPQQVTGPTGTHFLS